MPATEHEHSHLFAPVKLGQVPLANRVALAPMTRVSATYAGDATDAMAAYYERYAMGGFGLLITEGIYTDTSFSQGNLFQPGLALPEHTYFLEEGDQQGSCQRRQNVRPADARRPAIPRQSI
jgi:2,4-dienoyl-CoA reductase-like NADH-dependent reductase (Old Yellow Enzyme family)